MKISDHKLDHSAPEAALKPDHPRLLDYRLDDNLTAQSGPILISGTQALVRLPLMQARLDRQRGWNTAGFVSGYRGSPLGALDQALWKAQPLLDAHQVRFLPAINEELGEQFTGDYALHYHFAPEFLVKRGPDGRARAKRSFGPAARYGLKLLAALRGLRGTPFDPLSWSPARRSARALAGEYATLIGQLLPGLTAAKLENATQIAAWPDRVRGFGRVRQTALARVRAQTSVLRNHQASSATLVD